VIAGLKARDAAAVREAIQADMIEGGTLLVDLLGKLESGAITKEDLRRAALGSSRLPAAGRKRAGTS
jgi:hypothetical protein